MKRRTKPTVLSIVLGVLAAATLFFAFAGASVVFAVAAVLLIVGSVRTRSRESFSDYRDRYEERYGLSDKSDDADTSAER